MPYSGANTRLVTKPVASPALARSSRGAIGIFFGVFVPAPAMREISSKFQAAKVTAICWGKNFLQGQALLCAGNDRVRFKTGLVGKFNGHVPRAVNLHPTIDTLVALLLLMCCPAAILRRVGAVIVDSVQRISVWARPHIGNEGAKTNPALLPPTVTNVDAASAVIGIGNIVRFVATPNHAEPQTVEGGNDLLFLWLSPVSRTHPFNIIRRIWTGNVFAFKQRPFRAFSYVSNELSERVPRITQLIFAVLCAATNVSPRRMKRVFIFVRHTPLIPGVPNFYKEYSNAV